MTQAAREAVPSSRLRRGRLGPSRGALVLLGVFALLLAGVELSVGATVPVPSWIPLAFTGVFVVWAAAGIMAWWRRPTNGTGGLLLVGAVFLFVNGAGNLGLPGLVELGAVFATSILAITVHLLHAFPSGRLRGAFSVTTVAVGYGVAFVLQAPLYLLPSAPSTWRTVAEATQSAIGLAVMVATVVILVRRLRSADPKNLRVLLPLYLYGSLAVLAIPVSASVIGLLGGDLAVVGGVQLVVLAGIPVAFLAGVLFGGYTHTVEADALSAWLGVATPARTAVGPALARALGDDSLRVAYWSEERGEFLDERGAPADARDRRAPRQWEEVRVESRLVGAISYDGRMIADPEAVRRAAQVFAIALDRERLTAALMASNEALLRSRLRLVETADRERARIARDLHDGLQVQLVLLALEAQQIANSDDAHPSTAEAATELRRRIDDAAAQLRLLVHAVLPSALVERGLTAATEDLVDRLAMPATLTSDVDDRDLDPAIAHSAYFIVAEALSNAVKHSGARSVSVELRRGSGELRVRVTDDGGGGARLEDGTGLKGLADRVDALGGSFELISPEGGGTEVKVELPCGS
ncbi:histidine kinase [Herbiconiux sp. KACC 21604]|uniref:sensor histidine kinase n=1 Tax=unclassified Herbiconiux TaxID=2618217 RepID=UPI001491CCAE|nr:ATP-binding protein [Herbiconiux sp. SALV-R1]QJU53385.1 ATPase [Herbiconiux sp. SALV-R1]WPO88349.1 histidine kinase [Herbiconiux sp. KACC 21604]